MLSVVIPAYNEEAMISKTANVISSLLIKEKIPYEIIFVDDGSKDQTWQNICNEHKINANIKGITFSRNFGKESAMFAGLNSSVGDCAVVIDCDLQHPPEKIIEMYNLWKQGFEVVEGVKRSRGKESFLHTVAARTFYKIISDATGIDMERASDFKLLDRKAVNVLLKMTEKNAFFRALSSWIGFKTAQVEYDVREREEGKSKWSTKSLIRYALTNITSFTSAPMEIILIFGTIFTIIALILVIKIIIQFFVGVPMENNIFLVSLICFVGGILMISQGITGYYIAKVYDEVKGRPRYIVASSTDSFDSLIVK